jgi:GTP-binding protein
MSLPRIAIVGRPNVGKSSLLNLIAHERVSIVDPTPGTTRDRVSVVVTLDPPDNRGEKKRAEVIDTGGFGVYVAEGERFNEVGADLASLTRDIEGQIAAAVSGADVILFCVDCQAGITSQDEVIAQMLREQKLGSRVREGGEQVPVVVVATKCDGPKWEAHAWELAGLGFGVPVPISSKNNYFRREFLDRLWELTPVEEGEPEPQADLRIAIIGKRNAGKSTLVNALAGQPRVIVSEIAGTTRDAVDVLVEMDGKRVLAIDTAGLRRKSSFQNQIEWYALDRAERAVARCDVVLLLIDATESISQVDEHLAQMANAAEKPCVVVINKWDLAAGQKDDSGREATPERYEAYVRRELKGMGHAPIVAMSAATGLNLKGMMRVAFDLHEQASTRVGTGELNRTIRGIIEERTPSSPSGIEARVFYASQVRTNPPTIVLVVNDPVHFTNNYEKYLLNRMRERLPFGEVPIRLILRARSRVERRERAAQRKLHELDQATGQFVEQMTGSMIDEGAFLEGLPEDAKAYFED